MLFDLWEKSYISTYSLLLLTYYLIDKFRASEEVIVKKEEIKSKNRQAYAKLVDFWPTRKDLNLRPSESESDALSSCATGRYF